MCQAGVPEAGNVPVMAAATAGVSVVVSAQSLFLMILPDDTIFPCETHSPLLKGELSYWGAAKDGNF